MEFHQVNAGFSYGEIDPKLQAQVNFQAYDRSVKTAKNVLSIPQGGFTRRFGSKYVVDTLATSKDNVEIFSYVYDNEAVYCLVYQDLKVDIYLENTYQATVATPYPKEIVQQLSFVQVENVLITLHPNYPPQQLVRTALPPNIITGFSAPNSTLTLTTTPPPAVPRTIYPVTFSDVGVLPTTTPQVFKKTLYYGRMTNATDIRLYFTPEDAQADIKFFTVATAGVGASVNVFNTWTQSAIAFVNQPTYPFPADTAIYTVAGFTFTAAAVSGTFATPTTLTASAAIFTTAMIGGIFSGNGGIARIKAFTSSTVVDIYTYDDFINTSAFAGSDASLQTPVWSDSLGYPRCGTFFQQRLFFGGSRSLPNGVWGSVLFSPYDFNDAETLDDDGIGFYPSAGSSNVIKAMTSSKSLIVHSNTGNYTTPITSDVPVTPKTFSLTEQNKDGISNVLPAFIDNQIIYIDRSANNVKSMAWSIEQGSYVNTNISITAANLIETPVDMAVFSEPAFTDGFFLICVNSDGHLAIYNSLIEQEIKGWSRAETKTNTGAEVDAFYRRITSGLNRAWVIAERFINGATRFMLEELEFEVRVDCARTYKFTTPSAILTGLTHLTGQSVQIFGTPIVVTPKPGIGVVFPNQIVPASGIITLPEEVTSAFVGIGFESLIEPLPINVQMQTGPTLYIGAHVRNVYIQYLESAGMELQGYDIPTQNMQNVVMNEQVRPATDVFKFCLMEGWDTFEYTIRIVQRFPLPMTILAIGYDLEI